MTKFTRRSALKGLVLGSSMAAFGGLQTFGNLLSAQADLHPDEQVPDRYYIFCYFPGGWDILVSLDPRNPKNFAANNASKTRILPGYDLLSFEGDPLRGPSEAMTFGPFIGNLMKPNIVDRMTVIRGMSMDTLTHQVGRRRFLTGKPPAGLAARGSSMDTWLAATLAQDEPLPNLSVRTESYNKGLPNFASAIRSNSSSDLLRVLSPGNVQLEKTQDEQLDALLKQHALCNQSQLSPLMRDAESSRLKVKGMLDKQLDQLFDFRADTPQMEAIRDHFGIRRGLTTGSEVEAAIAAIAITNGVSRCVSVNASVSLDTHFDNWTRDQGPNQMRGLNSVAAIAEYLEKTQYKNTGNSWLDHTTIVGFSEFSRTPLLNANTGRDHWLNNACFLLGGGIKGNNVIGASSDFGMYPQAVNLETGRLDQGGEIIRPEHILQALYDEVHVGDEPDLRVNPLKALMK